MTERTNERERVLGEVREHYGRVAEGGGKVGCAPGCCGTTPEMSGRMGYTDAELSAVPEGANMGLGCGNPQGLAGLREGETVVDLGSGGGFDCFLAARQVGPEGRVIGVDMTAEMVSKARDNAEKLAAENVEFRLGQIEALPLADGTADVILSNCVINLSPDKPRVFREAFRALKPGGRLALSDVLATAEIPEHLRAQAAARVGCVAGAATIGETERMLADAGFEDVAVTPIPESRELIRDWLPESGAEAYVVSATIEATKPGSGTCCDPGCCSEEAAP